jgi:hypothetical protein
MHIDGHLSIDATILNTILLNDNSGKFYGMHLFYKRSGLFYNADLEISAPDLTA